WALGPIDSCARAALVITLLVPRSAALTDESVATRQCAKRARGERAALRNVEVMDLCVTDGSKVGQRGPQGQAAGEFIHGKRLQDASGTAYLQKSAPRIHGKGSHLSPQRKAGHAA